MMQVMSGAKFPSVLKQYNYKTHKYFTENCKIKQIKNITKLIIIKLTNYNIYTKLNPKNSKIFVRLYNKCMLISKGNDKT